MKTLVSALAVAGLAGSAFGLIGADSIDRSNLPVFDQNNLPAGMSMNAAPIDGRIDDRVGTETYSNMSSGSGYLANAAFSGTISVEDYATTLSDGASDGVDGTGGATFNLVEFGFVGGVAAGSVDKVVFFDFFDVAGNFVDGFGINFANFGNFIYTITITPGSVQAPVEGLLGMFTNAGTNAQHFLSDATPTVGSKGTHNETLVYGPGFFDFDYGNGNGVVNLDFLFRLNVPTPGTAALFGLAGLAGIRRRR
jgi:hypothetical protein